MNRMLVAISSLSLIAFLAGCAGSVTVGLRADVDPYWDPLYGPPGGRDLTSGQAEWVQRNQARPAGR